MGVEGDLLISSDSTGGFDSNNDLQYTSTFTVGASYILDSSSAPTVVTDIKLMPTNDDTVECPNLYEKKAVVGQVGGDGATNRDKTKGSNLMALCVKKQPCAMKVQYVSRVEAIATSETNLDAFTLPDGCEMIGTWDPDWAKSHTSGEVGQWTTGLFQCKSSCTSEMCAKVKITAMEPTGIPEINKKANVVGDDATQTADACGARSMDKPLDKTLTLTSGEEITNTQTYTLDKSLGHTFSGTLSTSMKSRLKLGSTCGEQKSRDRPVLGSPLACRVDFHRPRIRGVPRCIRRLRPRLCKKQLKCGRTPVSRLRSWCRPVR